MALHYIKELNHKRASELDDYEQKIKGKIDDKATAIGEKYKVHLQNFQQKNNEFLDR